MLMIRLFLTLCKCFHLTKNNDDYEIYRSYTNNALPDSVPCPFSSCHAKENFHDDGCYTRILVCYTDSRVERYEITIPRVECNSCGHSHALLAPVIIPYSPFSFHFVISLLYDYITHKYNTIAALCQKYDIAVSTLYRIFHRFISDRKLMLGMMEAAVTEAHELLSILADRNFTGQVDQLLHDFFKHNCTSFLQARCRIRLKPKFIPDRPSPSP
jgi:hypothetical protein